MVRWRLDGGGHQAGRGTRFGLRQRGRHGLCAARRSGRGNTAVFGRCRAGWFVNGTGLVSVGQGAALIVWQRLVGLPVGLFLLRGELLGLLERQPGAASLRGCHACPFGHALLHTLLVCNRHGRKTRRHLKPFGLARGVDTGPIPLQGQQSAALLRGQTAPGGACTRRSAGRAGGCGCRRLTDR